MLFRSDMDERIVHCLTLNSLTLNVGSLNVATSRRLKEKPIGYGVDNWLFDDGQNVLWDNEGVVLTDK